LGKLIKLSHGGLEEKLIWKYLVQMLLGLRYIHSLKILHRDMKTINVFLTDNGEVRIGDLGVAKVAQDQSMFAQTVVGTPYYLSPELCEERPYNEKSDVWALGCIVYEMCTKSHPFKATNQGALALKIIKGMYQPIPSSYSADLAQVLALMLTKDYWRRPTTGQLLASNSRSV
jgi:NIMA (never in mitosis gene a)-related kinase